MPGHCLSATKYQYYVFLFSVSTNNRNDLYCDLFVGLLARGRGSIRKTESDVVVRSWDKILFIGHYLLTRAETEICTQHVIC